MSDPTLQVLALLALAGLAAGFVDAVVALLLGAGVAAAAVDVVARGVGHGGLRSGGDGVG